MNFTCKSLRANPPGQRYLLYEYHEAERKETNVSTLGNWMREVSHKKETGLSTARSFRFWKILHFPRDWEMAQVPTMSLCLSMIGIGKGIEKVNEVIMRIFPV